MRMPGLLNTNRIIRHAFVLCATVSSLVVFAGCETKIATKKGSSGAAVSQLVSASSLSFSVNEDTTYVGVLGASLSQGITFSIVSNGSKGTATVLDSAVGSFMYVPNANANGSDSFSFKVNDGKKDSDPATVFVTITPINDAPVASNGSFSMNEDGTYTGTLTASDIDGDPLSFSIVANGSKGTVTITNASTGAFQYVPAAHTYGSDSFTFRVNDGTVNSNTATVSVTINHVNHAPVASNGSFTMNEDGSYTGSLLGSDIDGDALTFSIVANGSKGTATITNAATGAFQYVPNAHTYGSDSFTFKVYDGALNSNTATVSVTINHVNHAPVASNGSFTMNEDGSYTGSLMASDIDGDALTFSIVANGSKGTATITNAATGAFQYVPTAYTYGSDSFTFKVNDGTANSNTATISVTINHVNHAPVAVADASSTNMNTAKTISPVANDTDVDGDTLSLQSFDAASAQGGSVVNAGGNQVTYTPANNFVGVDTFNYVVSDGHGGTASGTVTVTVNAVLPTAAAWFKADAGIVQSSNQVSQWQDQSGHAFHANQATVSRRPIYHATGGANNQAYLSFDGSDDNMDLGANYLYSTNDGMSFFVVVQSLVARGAGGNVVMDFGYGAEEDIYLGWDISTGGMRIPMTNGGVTPAYIDMTHSYGTAWVILSYVAKFNNTLEMWINGNDYFTASAVGATRVTSAEIWAYDTRQSGGGPVTIGMQSKTMSESSRNLSGNLSELAVFDRYFTTAQRQLMECQLSSKYGIAIGHACN